MNPWPGRPAPVAALVLLLSSCELAPPPHLLGGDTTIFDETPNAFAQPAPGLERDDELHFFVGNSFFNQNWVLAPASTEARDGLGPLFNTRSCAGCHFKDGRGRPPEGPREMGTGYLLRLSLPGAGSDGGPRPEPGYGGQLQDQGIPGVPAEGRAVIRYESVKGTFGDGEPWELRRPVVSIEDVAYGVLSEDLLVSARVAPQMIGMGLLEAVPEGAVLALADPEDADGDGISGRANRVWDEAAGAPALGRFGWKANQPTVAQQAAGAFLGDLGITTPMHPTNDCTEIQEGCRAAPGGGDPEIAEDDFRKVVLYASTLAVPAMRDAEDPRVVSGFHLFQETGCAACHTPTLHTEEHPTFAALSNQTIHPYTDLLLHDMGEGLADGRPDFEAEGREWRTPPLWGIGLVETVNGHTFYLHDGRARNLTEAILWHGGEAEGARDRFVALPGELRAALLRFLESL
ncbi:MAG: di-heme oxidoredictase family protein [Gemmatimonadota bacterium]